MKPDIAKSFHKVPVLGKKVCGDLVLRPAYHLIDPDFPDLRAKVEILHLWQWIVTTNLGVVASGLSKRKRPAMHECLKAMREFKAKLSRAEGRTA